MPRALHRHRPDQVLAAAVVRRLHGRHIEHPEQFAPGVEHRGRRAGQADEGGAKVVTLVHRHRHLVGEHGGDPAGALLALRPAGAQVQPGAPAVGADRRFHAVIDGPALGVGEHHAVVGVTHPAVQARDFLGGNPQEAFGMLAALAQRRLAEDTRPLQGAGVQMVLIHRTPPGVEDKAGHRGFGHPVGMAQHAADAVHVGFRVGRQHGASTARIVFLVPVI
ncbi:MAG: hypothetical protein GAK45_00268 [Pseudomonas citronellolis]|nr:MAG: hypothetical protein GAK45_00268 [Pseudomonas citronellolis]